MPLHTGIYYIYIKAELRYISSFIDSQKTVNKHRLFSKLFSNLMFREFMICVISRIFHTRILLHLSIVYCLLGFLMSLRENYIFPKLWITLITALPNHLNTMFDSCQTCITLSPGDSYAPVSIIIICWKKNMPCLMSSLQFIDLILLNTVQLLKISNKYVFTVP